MCTVAHYVLACHPALCLVAGTSLVNQDNSRVLRNVNSPGELARPRRRSRCVRIAAPCATEICTVLAASRMERCTETTPTPSRYQPIQPLFDHGVAVAPWPGDCRAAGRTLLPQQATDRHNHLPRNLKVLPFRGPRCHNMYNTLARRHLF
jgi:hypothetical protein